MPATVSARTWLRAHDEVMAPGNVDRVILVHREYQSTPRLISAMPGLIGDGRYPRVLGSRILPQNAVGEPGGR